MVNFCCSTYLFKMYINGAYIYCWLMRTYIKNKQTFLE